MFRIPVLYSFINEKWGKTSKHKRAAQAEAAVKAVKERFPTEGIKLFFVKAE